jgi:hypothetical protein
LAIIQELNRRGHLRVLFGKDTDVYVLYLGSLQLCSSKLGVEVKLWKQWYILFFLELKDHALGCFERSCTRDFLGGTEKNTNCLSLDSRYSAKIRTEYHSNVDSDRYPYNRLLDEMEVVFSSQETVRDAPSE